MKRVFSYFLLFMFTMAFQCQDDSFISDKCTLEPETGSCKAAFIRYYYDQEENKCKEFIWGGCDGVVPFETLEECQKNCGCVE